MSLHDFVNQGLPKPADCDWPSIMDRHIDLPLLEIRVASEGGIPSVVFLPWNNEDQCYRATVDGFLLTVIPSWKTTEGHRSNCPA